MISCRIVTLRLIFIIGSNYSDSRRLCFFFRCDSIFLPFSIFNRVFFACFRFLTITRNEICSHNLSQRLVGGAANCFLNVHQKCSQCLLLFCNLKLSYFLPSSFLPFNVFFFFPILFII